MLFQPERDETGSVSAEAQFHVCGSNDAVLARRRGMGTFTSGPKGRNVISSSVGIAAFVLALGGRSKRRRTCFLRRQNVRRHHHDAAELARAIVT